MKKILVFEVLALILGTLTLGPMGGVALAIAMFMCVGLPSWLISSIEKDFFNKDSNKHGKKSKKKSKETSSRSTSTYNDSTRESSEYYDTQKGSITIRHAEKWEDRWDPNDYWRYYLTTYYMTYGEYKKLKDNPKALYDFVHVHEGMMKKDVKFVTEWHPEKNVGRGIFE